MWCFYKNQKTGAGSWTQFYNVPGTGEDSGERVFDKFSAGKDMTLKLYIVDDVLEGVHTKNDIGKVAFQVNGQLIEVFDAPYAANSNGARVILALNKL